MDRAAPGVGHNSQDVEITVEVRFFNSLSRYGPADGRARYLMLPAGSTVADVLERFRIARRDIFVVFRNGRDITPGLVGDAIRADCAVEDGDVIALSGPVPYSYGYGAPVV